MVSLLFHWLFTAVFGIFHPFYISMTEIEHNKKEQSLEISVRIFTDDLEKSIRKSYSGKVDLLNAKEKAVSEGLLKSYITKHLSLKADGKNLSLNLLGFESKEGSIWTYFEVPAVSAIKTLEVRNDILHELHDKQINFIHVIANEKDETEKLDYPDSYKKFSL